MIQTSYDGGNPQQASAGLLDDEIWMNKGSVCRYFNAALVGFETFAGGRENQRTCSDVVKMDAAVVGGQCGQPPQSDADARMIAASFTQESANEVSWKRKQLKQLIQGIGFFRFDDDSSQLV